MVAQSDDRLYTFHLLTLLHLQVKNGNSNTHLPTDQSGFVLSRCKHLLSSGIFVKAVFASMEVEEKNDILSMHRQGYIQQQKNCRNIQQMQLYNFQTCEKM